MAKVPHANTTEEAKEDEAALEQKRVQDEAAAKAADEKAKADAQSARDRAADRQAATEAKARGEDLKQEFPEGMPMITVETTGDFMLIDPQSGAHIAEEGKTKVPHTQFIDQRIEFGDLKKA